MIGSGWRVFGLLLINDIRLECRRPHLLATGLLFGALMMFITAIAVDGAGDLSDSMTAGLLWLNIFFTTAIGFLRQDRRDEEYGAATGIRFIPQDLSVIYYARWCSTLIFILCAVTVLTGMFFLLFNRAGPVRPLWFAASLGLGTLGLSGMGTFVSLLTAGSTLRDVLLPMLLFPVSLPLFLGVDRLTASALSGAPVPWSWAGVLIGYLLMVSVLPWLLYETLMEV
ncbi:cytochrome C biogenesis protein B [Alicyclobacillus contaminans]|uniref:heme exporter protein CcmB n=1 Tax=Alicyclobacillus contaminans TaxID=392016 RepID=UPI000416E312|nr:heme exporter protein CcmB [Alicyclobacillus contaminans]GMA52430.1 cytochrome C biogenesis protein B [Alicyclobacillus contaminans]